MKTISDCNARLVAHLGVAQMGGGDSFCREVSDGKKRGDLLLSRTDSEHKINCFVGVILVEVLLRAVRFLSDVQRFCVSTDCELLSSSLVAIGFTMAA